MIKLQDPGGAPAAVAGPDDLAGIRAGLGLGNVDNTRDVDKPVSTAQAAAIGARLAAADLGGSSKVAELRDLIGAHQAFGSGYRTLVVGASTFSRCMVTVNATAAAYQRAAGVATVEFSMGSMQHVPSVGELVLVVSNSRGDVAASTQLASVTALGGGSYRATYADNRPDVPGGALADLALSFPALGTNTHAWVTMLNAELDGALDVVNVSCGGAVVAGFNDAGRLAGVAALGEFDFGLFNFGYGNDLNAGADTAAIAAAILQALASYSRLVRRGFFISNLGSANPGITPASPKWTANARLHAFLRREVPRRFPNVEFVDVEAQALALATYGGSDTPDMQAGRPPSALFDSSGLHYTPLSSALVARVIADYLRPHLRSERASFLRACQPDNVLLNNAPDANGGRNPSAVGGWYGAVATSPVTLAGIGTIGSAPAGMTVAAQNLTAGMSASIGLEPNPAGGFSTLLTFADPVGSTSGPAVQWKYDGGATPFLSFFNDPANQGAWCDFWCEFSLAGFNEDKLRSISVMLIGESAAGLHMLCAPLADQGVNNMFGVGGTWQQGVGGILRSPSAFVIPARTYTAAYLLIDFRGYAAGSGGGPLGSVEARLGLMRLSRREAVA